MKKQFSQAKPKEEETNIYQQRYQFMHKPLFDAGLSLLPCDPINKVPRIKSWKHLSKAIHPNTRFGVDDSVAVVTGKVSGSLEIIDFDLKYDITGNLYPNYCQMVNDHDNQILSKMVIQKTQNGGFHFFYRCDVIEKNTKLARREATLEEKKRGEKIKVLIETRGEGGYVLVHPSKGYSIIQGSLFEIQTITPDEREILFACAKSFNQIVDVFVQKKTKEIEKYNSTGLTPFDDYNTRGDCVGLLQKHHWTIVRSQKNKIYLKRPGTSKTDTSGNFDVEKNWFSVFSTSTEFEPETAYLPYAVYTILEHAGDFNKSASALYKDGYGERFKPTNSAPPVQAGEYIDKFWTSFITEKGKLVINFSYQQYKQWLQQRGYYRYCYAPNQYMFVQIENNILTQVYKKDIRKTVLDYILALDLTAEHATNDDIFEYIAKLESKIFSDGILEMLDEKDVEFCKDTRTNAFYFFTNLAVVITAQGINTLQYSELPGLVWNSQIIDHHIVIQGDVTNDFMSFIKNVTACDTDRFRSVSSIAGFLLHGYKDFSNCPAIVLNDEIISDDPEGGTGKGLFISGIKQFKKTHIIDGKNFTMTKSFAFQSIDLDTKLIAFEDVTKNFNFEKLFSIITEGITVEKKNKDEFFMPFVDSPKIIITTNYTVLGTGNSHDRRKVEVEFRQHYNRQLTPLTEFGRLLFHDWNKDDWGRFYRFMFNCVQLYLKNGIIRTAAVNLPTKHIVNQTAQELIDFASNLPHHKQIEKKQVHADFISAYPDFIKLKQRTMTDWIRKYAKYAKIDLQEWHTGSTHYFSFGKPGEIDDDGQEKLPF